MSSVSPPRKTKVALITGASSGIGLELARQLAARHVDLVLVSRDQAQLEKIAQPLRAEHGVSVHVLGADLATPAAAARVFEFTRAEGIAVDWLINNAGVGLYGEHLDLDIDGIASMLQLNVTALGELCFFFGKEMRARRSGRILNIASTAAYQPAPFFAAYGASKAYVLNFSEALAKELEDAGVRVSCLSPGPTATAFFRGVDEGGIENGHFDKSDRADPRVVAAIGLELMESGKLSKIVGPLNFLRTWSARFASRAMVASISKKLLAPKSKPHPA